MPQVTTLDRVDRLRVGFPTTPPANGVLSVEGAVTIGGTLGVTGATTYGATITPTTNDGAALGSITVGWSDLHLAAGGVINWANGEVSITETDAGTLTVAGTATLIDLAAGILEVNDAVRFDTGVAIVATSYSVGRDADATNQLHFNVPTGGTFEWSVNDVAKLSMATTGAITATSTLGVTGYATIGNANTISAPLAASAGVYGPVDGDYVGLEVINSQVSASGSTNETSALVLSWRDGSTSTARGVSLLAGKEGDYLTAGAADAYFAVQVTENNNPTERLRIASSGAVTIAAPSSGSGVTVSGGGIAVTGASRVTGGALDLGTATSSLGILKFNGNTSGTVTMQSAAAAGTWTMTLPTGVAGTNGFQLTDAGGDGVCSWAAAASLRAFKEVGARFDPQTALSRLLSVPVYGFHYKAGQGTGDSTTEYVGVMAEDAPWAMHYQGNVLNPVNAFGHTILAIQVHEQRIAALEARYAN